MRKLQSKTKFTREALVRTIKNRLVEAAQEASFQTIPLLKKRATEAVPALKQALDALNGADQALLKNQALVVLGRIMGPHLGSGGHAAILALRQDITAITLDERDEVKILAAARQWVEMGLTSCADARLDHEVKRWQWVEATLKDLEGKTDMKDVRTGEVQVVNVEALWRYSEHAVNSSIPVDKIGTKA